VSPPPDRDNRDNLDTLLKEFLAKDPREKAEFRRYIHERFNAILVEVGDVKRSSREWYTELKGDIRGVQARVTVLEDRHPPPHLVVASASRPISIPPEQLDQLGKETKSGKWRFDPEMIVSAIGNLRDQIDALDQAREVEAKLKKQAEEDKAKAEKKAADDALEADRKNARLRGWLTFVVVVLVALAGLFAYLAPRMGTPPAPVTAPAHP
jgi:hypothetical protein